MALYEKITHGADSSFSHKVYPYFTMPWHYHPEYELMVITSGGGKRFAGDYMDEFAVGDLVLYGENLPHYHMCYGIIDNDPERISSCEVIQFRRDIFPAGMDHIGEYAVISGLLKRSMRGIKFTSPPELGRILRMMKYLDSQTGVKRISALLRILDILGRIKEYKLLSGHDYRFENTGADRGDTVDKVYKYLTDNFKENIVLEDVASAVGFNPSSLCRYFKKRAQKSIFECLAEIRIGFACKLITGSRLNISQIAYEAGFRNIANFNRQFRAVTGRSPSQYRALYKL